MTEKFSLLYPEGKESAFNTLNDDTCNDLSLEGELKAASLITGIHEGQRSYKVFIAPPEGVSYAKDIAEKYGVTFDQLKKSIKK